MFRRTVLSLAVAALAASPAIYASEQDHHGGKHGNKTKVSIKKSIKIKKHVNISGHVRVYGRILVNASSMAVIKDKQHSAYNRVYNTHHLNNANADDNAMSNASGNIGLNVTAGDNNIQDNSAALASADARFVFGSSDAEVFVTQKSGPNHTVNSGNINNANAKGNALRNASGNIGVNISAGNSNLQKNNMAASVASSSMSTATVSNHQANGGNVTYNAGRVDVYTDTTRVTMYGSMRGSYSGVAAGSYAGSESGRYFGSESGSYFGRTGGRYAGIESGSYVGRTGGRYAGSESGSYAGTARGSTAGSSWQANNIYLDSWGPCTAGEACQPHGSRHHPTNGTNLGHIDLDGQSQGAVNNPLRGNDANGTPIGGLAFDNRGSYGGSESGRYAGREGGSYSGGESGRYSGREGGAYSGSESGRYFGREGGVYGGSERGRYAGREAGRQTLAGTFTGYVTTTRVIYTPTANNASISGNALRNANGNIGVNIASGTNNLQNNSLAISASTRPGGVGGAE